MYQIYTDKDIGRVQVRFDTVINRDLIGFDEALRLACLLVFRTSGFFDLLVDYTHSNEMTGDVLHDARQRTEWCVGNGLRRCAGIAADAILQRQIQGITQQFANIRIFDSRALAVDWLEGGDVIPFERNS